METTEIWAQLFLCSEDCLRMWDFFGSEFGLDSGCFVRRPHLTVYHARRPMPTVRSLTEPACVVVPAAETRFMVLTPGGESQRDGIDPRDHKVGIRIHRQSVALPVILSYRQRFLQHETPDVLGDRSPSTRKKSAFGARHFQPHMAIFRAGNNVERDLTQVGSRFRAVFGDLTFRRFIVDIVKSNGAS